MKGQWHQSVWSAADDQLDRLYTRDNRARGKGIYLVLWFGRQANRKHILTSPGGKTARPSSPSVMKDMLEQRCKAFQHGGVDIVVLDLTRRTIDF